MYSQQLHSFQGKCLQAIMHSSKLPTETVEAVCNKRKLVCGKLAAKTGRWSDGWDTGATLWYKHCMRGNGSFAQCHRECINYHDTFWLSNRRAEQSTAAHISHRYQESVLPVLYEPPVRFKHLNRSILAFGLQAANAFTARFLGGSTILNSEVEGSSSSSSSMLLPSSQETIEAIVSAASRSEIRAGDVLEVPITVPQSLSVCLASVPEEVPDDF